MRQSESFIALHGRWKMYQKFSEKFHERYDHKCRRIPHISCRRSSDNGGQSFVKNINSVEIDIDNRWVVPYSPLLSKTFNAHINVEFSKEHQIRQ